eukprot:TRINITY_DN26889_c0_g1_i1.p1 TRINITY_DN26889_c0_g1~~TRINITY_DN26889_c0_g1_i1.p1  ORF type:complete len:195 (+),score=70.57 TRINITY_DN26889_c0_g1_i1:59-643(+)
MALGVDTRRYFSTALPDVTVELSTPGADAPATRQVQRCVLTARSDKFAAMFGPRMSDMKEAAAGVIKLSVDSVQTFDRVYEFMRGAPVSAKSTQDWSDVVKLADEYLMTSLVAHCDRHLCRMLSIDNAVELLLSTVSLRLPQLQASARQLIAENFEVIAQQGVFVDKVDAGLLRDIVREFGASRKRKAALDEES